MQGLTALRRNLKRRVVQILADLATGLGTAVGQLRRETACGTGDEDGYFVPSAFLKCGKYRV